METKKIAEKLVNWCKEGDYETPYQHLYGPNIVSIENDGKGEGGMAEGFEGLQKKGEWWRENFEMHSSTVSEPIVADNWFSVRVRNGYYPQAFWSQINHVGNRGISGKRW